MMELAEENGYDWDNADPLLWGLIPVNSPVYGLTLYLEGKWLGKGEKWEAFFILV